MKRGRRNGKSVSTTKRFKTWDSSVSTAELRAFRNDPRYEDILVALLHAMKLPVEHWATVFVIQDFGDGRTEFKATDEEMGVHWHELVRAGKVQAFLRKSCDDATPEHCAEVERVIAELEADFLADEPPAQGSSFVN
jgi:hypothetical protein